MSKLSTLHTIHVRSPLFIFIPTTLQVLMFLEKEVGGSGTYEISQSDTMDAISQHFPLSNNQDLSTETQSAMSEVGGATPLSLNIVSQAK